MPQVNQTSPVALVQQDQATKLMAKVTASSAAWVPSKSGVLPLGLGVLLTLGLCAPAWGATCYENITRTTPDTQLQDHGNGTVTDSRTGLMWMQCSEGQTSANSDCTGNASKHTWKDALERASSKTYAGYTDWRLPNVLELLSIVEVACHNPAINATRFPKTPVLGYWSSSISISGTVDNAWTVRFDDGHSGPQHFSRTFEKPVRFVRGG